MPVPMHDRHNVSLLANWELGRRLKQLQRASPIAFETLQLVQGAANGYVWQPVSHAFTGDAWKRNADAVGALFLYYSGLAKGARALVLAMKEPGADYTNRPDLERRARAKLLTLSAKDVTGELEFISLVFDKTAGRVFSESRAFIAGASKTGLAVALYTCGHDDFLTKLGGEDRLPVELMTVLMKAAAFG